VGFYGKVCILYIFVHANRIKEELEWKPYLLPAEEEETMMMAAVQRE
jgi:hypothetical protein